MAFIKLSEHRFCGQMMPRLVPVKFSVLSDSYSLDTGTDPDKA